MRSFRNSFFLIVIAFIIGAGSVAKADDMAYLATGGGAFGTIDLNTGVFTQLGLTGIPVAGLALVGTTLYADGQGTAPNTLGQLYSVNPATGALMSIGSPTGIDFTAFGSYGSTLYALDHTSANARLYSINSATGVATLIGATNTGQPLAGYWAISTNSTALYFQLNSNLYTLNTSTGQATVVGGLGGGIQVGAIVEVGGVLYAGQDNPQPPLRIVTLNKSNGAATAVSNVTNSPGSNISAIYGLAPKSVISYQTYYLPEVVDGGSAGQWSWRTTLMLSNRDSSGAASVSVNFYNDDGTPMNVSVQGITGSQFSYTILPLGSLKIETSGAGNLKTGWAQVQADKSMSGISIFSFYDGAGNFVSEMGAPATAAATSFSLFVESSSDRNTGIAIANPNSSQAQVTLTLRDSGGNALGSPVTLVVPVNGHKEYYVTDADMFKGILPSDFQGTLGVVSNVPVVGMNQRTRGQSFTDLPLIQ